MDNSANLGWILKVQVNPPTINHNNRINARQPINIQPVPGQVSTHTNLDRFRVPQRRPLSMMKAATCSISFVWKKWPLRPGKASPSANCSPPTTEFGHRGQSRGAMQRQSVAALWRFHDILSNPGCLRYWTCLILPHAEPAAVRGPPKTCIMRLTAFSPKSQV